MFPHVREISPGKNAIFPSIYLPHLHHRLPSSLGLWLVWQPHPVYVCLMRFLFVRPEVCLQLPSDSSSPRTPLLLAMCLALLTRTQDFHLLDCAHAGRTTKNKDKTKSLILILMEMTGVEPVSKTPQQSILHVYLIFKYHSDVKISKPIIVDCIRFSSRMYNSFYILAYLL